jgi:NADH-quinone oxidoreductase subunit E
MNAANTPALLSEAAYKKIAREVAKFPAEQKQSAVMAALAIAQNEQGWMSQAVLEDVARVLQMPAIAVQEVATFYTMYNKKPMGQFKLTVCTNLPCQLRDGTKAAEYIKGKLGIGFTETTADGVFSLTEGECMGACGDSPVMLVNNERMCSFMNYAKIDALIDELRAKAGNSNQSSAVKG